MKQHLNRTITRIATETLQKLAFLFAFPDDGRTDEGPEPAVTGRVEFSGLFCGSMVVRIAASALPELAANMLGSADDAEIAGEAQQDAFKELTNVICGNVLPAIAGDQAEFLIGVPATLCATDAPSLIRRNTAECVVRLAFDEGFCDVHLFIEGKLPELKIED